MGNTENKSNQLTIEDHPEEEYVVIEGIYFAYQFFKELGMQGVPMGSLLRVVNRRTAPDGKTVSVALDWIMTQEQAQQRGPRIVTPRLTIPGKKVN